MQTPREQGLVFTDTLHKCVGRCWPGLLQPRVESLDAWLASRRSGDDIVLSMVFNVEFVVVARYRHRQDSSYRHPGMNPWRCLVDEGQRGEAMAYWRGTGSQ